MRAFDQSAGIVTRNTNSWSGNECFNNANSPSVSLHPSFPFPLPRRSPSSFRPPRPPRPRSPGTALKIYFHRRTDVTSLSRGSDACIDRQMSLAHLSPASPPPLPRAYALSSICSQLFPAKLFAFQSAPFCRAAPSICPVKCGARFRDTPNFRRMSLAEGERGSCKGAFSPFSWRFAIRYRWRPFLIRAYLFFFT